MEKSEFSETQFVLGYSRELFDSFGYLHPYHYMIYAPSTKEEKAFASDLILRHYKGRYYRFSEFYQFKRSKYFDKEVFSDLAGTTVIDTSKAAKYGFNIYNTVKTKQFNTLQRLALKKRYRVYYCAPLFHTISEFNNYFNTRSIQNNSMVFDLSQPKLQSAVIPPGSNHQIIFDKSNSYICSDPVEIQGIIARERENLERYQNEPYELENVVKDLYNFTVQEIEQNEFDTKFERPDVNLFEVRDMLLSYFNIHWFPIFNF